MWFRPVITSGYSPNGALTIWPLASQGFIGRLGISSKDILTEAYEQWELGITLLRLVTCSPENW